MFASEFDRNKASVLVGGTHTPPPISESSAPQQNLLWQSLALRTGGVNAKQNPSEQLAAAPSQLAKLAYDLPQPGQAPAQAPPVQAYPGVPLQQAPAAPLGAIDQARSDIITALERAVERVQAAIAARDGIGIIPHDVEEALCRFFPGFQEDFLDDILARIQPMSGWVPGIPVIRVPRPIPAGTRDAALLNQVNTPAHTLVRRVLPQMDPGADYVVVFAPDWYNNRNLRATRLLHEFFHYSFAGMFHDKPLNDAFGWQGFVSQVGGLQTGPAVAQRYPPCP